MDWLPPDFAQKTPRQRSIGESWAIGASRPFCLVFSSAMTHPNTMMTPEKRRLEVAAAFVANPRSIFDRAFDHLEWADELAQRLPPPVDGASYVESAGLDLARGCIRIASNRVADAWHEQKPHGAKVSPGVALSVLMPDALGRVRSQIGEDLAAMLVTRCDDAEVTARAKRFIGYLRGSFDTLSGRVCGRDNRSDDPISDFVADVLRDVFEALSGKGATPGNSGKPWASTETEAWLSKHPLPDSFRWPVNGQLVTVRPVHSLRGSFGRWVRETPYFPGLFDACHTVLAAGRGQEIREGADLAARLQSMNGRRRAA